VLPFPRRWRFAHGGASRLALAVARNLSSFCGISLFLAARPALAAADPCDFVSAGAPTASSEQVRRCYESVPFSRESLNNIVSVVEQHRAFSDLGGIYEARVHWKERLAAVGRRS
jgi:hypothetical protein